LSSQGLKTKEDNKPQKQTKREHIFSVLSWLTIRQRELPQIWWVGGDGLTARSNWSGEMFPPSSTGDPILEHCDVFKQALMRFLAGDVL